MRFRIASGTGRLAPSRDTTDSAGYASVGFTPRARGTIEVEAYLDDPNVDPVTFTITTGEPPDAIVKISGDNQSGRPGATLANPLVVEVIDANDDPVSGVTVTFTATAGGGSVSPASATTNNSGRAQTRLTLGDEPGDNTVTARVSGLTAVTFTAKSGMVVLVGASQRAPMYWISRTEGNSTVSLMPTLRLLPQTSRVSKVSLLIRRITPSIWLCKRVQTAVKSGVRVSLAGTSEPSKR